MKRADVAHVLRKARALTNEAEFVLVGSQAAHASFADRPEVMRQSGELDIYPLRRPEPAEVIDGAIREGSASTRPSATMHKRLAEVDGVPEAVLARLPRAWLGR